MFKILADDYWLSMEVVLMTIIISRYSQFLVDTNVIIKPHVFVFLTCPNEP